MWICRVFFVVVVLVFPFINLPNVFIMSVLSSDFELDFRDVTAGPKPCEELKSGQGKYMRRWLGCSAESRGTDCPCSYGNVHRKRVKGN